jgi:hypothetical protein
LGANTRFNHSRLDSDWERTIDQSQFGHQGGSVIGESECIISTGCHRPIDWASKRVQRHFCKDIQRSKGCSTKDCSTQD